MLRLPASLTPTLIACCLALAMLPHVAVGQTALNPQQIYRPPLFNEPPPPALGGEAKTPLDWLSSFRNVVLNTDSFSSIEPYISLSDRHKFEYLATTKNARALKYYKGLFGSIIRVDGLEVTEFEGNELNSPGQQAKIFVVTQKTLKSSQGAYQPPPYVAGTVILQKQLGNWRFMGFEYGASLEQLP